MLEKEKDRYRNAIQLLEKAQDLVDESVKLIKYALILIDKTLQDRASAYLLPQLTMAAHEEHDYLGSNSCNIDSLMESICEELKGKKCPDCDGSGTAFANDPPTGYRCETCEGTGRIS